MTDTATRTGFTEERVVELPLLQATAHEFVHATGAKWIHFATEDEDNRFCAILPTVPTDETGAPHILEHCLFAGSKRYPDAASQGGVVTTGGGAWTGWEYTWYFFGSPIHTDFLKKADIWCDSLFEPLLEEGTFKFQAHHLEFESPEDPSTPLRYRGVIYNEQKGILGLPVYVTWMEVCRALFPGHPYALEHGGTPRDVPKITYEQLKAFHRRHYHPAKAHFLTWGNIPVDDVTSLLDEALTRVPERPVEEAPFPVVPVLAQPARRVGKLPIGSGEDPTGRGAVLMGWVTADATDPYESLVHDLIVELLMGSPTAPLRHALATSGLGKGFCDSYDKYGIRYLRHMTTAGVEGCDPSAMDEVERLITSTLERVVEDGFDDITIDAALNSLEFRRRTLADPQGNEGQPGSFFIAHVNTPWLAGADPLANCDMDDVLRRFADERAAGRPVEDRIKKWYLDNPHRAVVAVEPDPGADVRLEAEENTELAAIKSRLTDDDTARIIRETKELGEFLAARSAPPTAPTPPTMPSRHVEPITSDAGGTRVVGYPTRTNGITYVDMYIDIGDLPDDLWDLLHLFTLAITKAGTDERSSTEMDGFVGTVTGGLEAEVLVPLQGTGDEHLRLLRLGGRALERRQDDLVSLLVSLLRSATFTPDLLRAIVDGALTHAEQWVFIEATAHLKRLAGARLRTSWSLRERANGFTQLHVLRDLAAKDATELATVCRQLDAIREHIGRTGAIEVFAATASPDALTRLVASIHGAFATLPSGASATGPVSDAVDTVLVHEARTFGQPTAFNTAILRVPTFVHPDGPALLIAGSIAGRRVREEVARKGTAYSAAVDGFSDAGSFALWSIRDPNVARTYRAFDTVLDDLRTSPVTDNELGIGRLEASIVFNLPAPPAERARRDYLRTRTGFDAAAQERFHDVAKDVTAEDVRRVANEHLSGPVARASLTSVEMAEKAGAEGYPFDDIREV
jgi:hypothetical protein